MNRYLKIAALALLGTSAFAASKESSDLQKVPSGSTADVIVQFTSQPTTTMLNQVTAQGATLKQQLPLIKSAVYSIPQKSIFERRQSQHGQIHVAKPEGEKEAGFRRAGRQRHDRLPVRLGRLGK